MKTSMDQEQCILAATYVFDNPSDEILTFSRMAITASSVSIRILLLQVDIEWKGHFDVTCRFGNPSYEIHINMFMNDTVDQRVESQLFSPLGEENRSE